MNKALIFLLTPIVICNVFAQTEKSNYKTVADEFESNYNQENFKAIFNSFSDEMQTALPIDKTVDFLAGQDGTYNYNGMVFRTTNGGDSWSPQAGYPIDTFWPPSVSYDFFISIAFNDSVVGYTSAVDGAILKTVDEGDT